MYQYKVSFSEAVRRALSQYCKFSGRASRSEYWWFSLFEFISTYALAFLLGFLLVPGFFFENAFVFDTSMGIVAMCVFYGWELFLILPSLAICVRRLHDTGHSGWNLLWGLLPVIGSIILLVYYCTHSQMSENKYGPIPNLMYDDGKNGFPPYGNQPQNKNTFNNNQPPYMG